MVNREISTLLVLNQEAYSREFSIYLWGSIKAHFLPAFGDGRRIFINGDLTPLHLRRFVAKHELTEAKLIRLGLRQQIAHGFSILEEYKDANSRGYLEEQHRFVSLCILALQLTLLPYSESYVQGIERDLILRGAIYKKVKNGK